MNQEILVKLRRALSNLYTDENSIRRILHDSRIDSSRIALNSAPISNWHSVLTETERTGQINDLLETVKGEYGGNQEFQLAYDSLSEPEIRPSLANAHALLMESTEDSQEFLQTGIDPEIETWIVTHSCNECLQMIEKGIRVSSMEDARKLARQVAALANGAIRLSTEFGYLIFELNGTRIRDNLNNPSTSYIQPNPASISDFSKKILESVEPFLFPSLSIAVAVIAAKGSMKQYAYLRVTPKEKLPTFAMKDSRNRLAGWELPIWSMESGSNKKLQNWRVRPVTKAEGVELYSNYIRIQYDEFTFELPPNQSNDLSLEENSHPRLQEELKKFEPDSPDKFIDFLNQQVLSDDTEERALSAFLYSKITDVSQHRYEQISRFLIGLLIDENKAVKCSLESLKKVGDTRYYHFLTHVFQFYSTDADLQEAILLCLSELSPNGSSIHDFVTLWNSCTAKDALQRVFNTAIEKLDRKHQIPRFDKETRELFFEHLHKFNYQYTSELVQQDNGRMCLGRVLRECLYAFVNYGVLYRESKFLEALAELKRGKTLLELFLNERYKDDDIIRNLPEKDKKNWFEDRIVELEQFLSR